MIRELEEELLDIINAPPASLTLPGWRGALREAKRHLWKAVADGNVDQAMRHQMAHGALRAVICVNSRTGWTIIHEAVERGHSGAMLNRVVQLMGPDSVNKKNEDRPHACSCGGFEA